MSFLASTKGKIALTAAIAAAAAAGAVVAVFALTGDDAPKSTSVSVPVANGIARPDATCVTTDGTDRREYWDGNGWWTGRVDGTVKEMPARSALALKLSGHQINSAWICAPRTDG